MSNRKASITTCVRYLTCIKVFCQWCITEGYLGVNPASLIKIKEPKRVMKAVPLEDIQKLLGQFNSRDFKSVRNKAIILVLLDTGLRVSECADLKLCDMNINRGILKVTGKGNKERLVRVGNVVQKALWRYISLRQSNSDNLWTDAIGNAISANTIKLIMKRMSAKLGIKCNPHALRRSFAIYYLRNGGNIFELQLLLGHSSLEMVKRYLGSLQFEDAFKEHIKASPVDNLKFR
jgi:site-specific recombinase XerD